MFKYKLKQIILCEYSLETLLQLLKVFININPVPILISFLQQNFHRTEIEGYQAAESAEVFLGTTL